MSEPDDPAIDKRRSQKYVGLAVLLLVGLAIGLGLTTKHHGATGVPPGRRVPPFAVPLAVGSIEGDANIATRPRDGNLGRRPACTVRGQGILSDCQLYERGPLVLALFIEKAGCQDVLGELQALQNSFPGVQFAGVAIKGSRSALRQIVRTRKLTFPVGYDRDGILPGLYEMATCPQITFAYPGGVVASRALLSRPALSTLRARVAALTASSRARGWRPSAA